MNYTVGKNYVISKGHPNRCGRKLKAPLCLVFHYTGNSNKGADDIANARYFRRPFDRIKGYFNEKSGGRFRYASAHYVVDKDSIQLCIPEDEVAWHVGARSYTSFVKSKLFNRPNDYTIGIEMCNNSDGDWKKTTELAIELGADIMIRNNIPITMVMRHYDITRKVCPAPFVNLNIKEVDPRWVEFKRKLTKRVLEKRQSMTGGKPIISHRVIKLGSRGEDVKLLQKTLNEHGFDCGTADGIYGVKTVNSVKAFQRECGLVVDGIVGAKTWAKLEAFDKPVKPEKGKDKQSPVEDKKESPSVALERIIGEWKGSSHFPTKDEMSEVIKQVLELK